MAPAQYTSEYSIYTVLTMQLHRRQAVELSSAASLYLLQAQIKQPHHTYNRWTHTATQAGSGSCASSGYQHMCIYVNIYVYVYAKVYTYTCICIYIYVCVCSCPSINAIGPMPLREVDSKTSTAGIPCLYALRMPRAFCKNYSDRFETSAC
jgi:hypothetical protein